MSRLEEMKEVSCFNCHAEILWKDPMCIHENKSYCRNCYLQILRKQNKRYKQALEEILHLRNVAYLNEYVEKAEEIAEKALKGETNEE